MLEVLVAAVLVGMIVGPLATAFSGIIQQAREVRSIEHADVSMRGITSADAWEWGPRVLDTRWSPGPVLHVKTTAATGDRDGAATSAGLWVDGWLLDEIALPAAGAPGTSEDDIRLESPVWSGLMDQEVVIRVRFGGAWGPPWRLAVPGPDGASPISGQVAPGDAPDPITVVHRPGAGTSSLGASWAGVALPAPPFGLLFVVDASPSGWAGATLDGRSQWWWAEEGRSVDVYY